MLNKYMELNNMDNETKKNELINKIEALPEAVNTVINMLDKNIINSMNHGTSDELSLLYYMQSDLLYDNGILPCELNFTVQYLTGRFIATAADFETK